MNHSILVVEDERIVARDLQETLGGLGYDAFAIASSGDEAIAVVDERKPDLVLMDIRIKGPLDGVSTAELLRDKFSVPVVYLTAHSDDLTVGRAKETGPYGFLVKPVRSAELKCTIEVSIHRHAMEQRLREREAWYSTTLRSLPDGVIAVDPQVQVNFMNAAAEELTGIRGSATRGMPLGMALHESPVKPVFTVPLQRALDEKRIIGPSELILNVPGHEPRHVSGIASPVFSRGRMLGAVMVVHDLTDQRRIREQLEHSDRLTALGTMAAGVAHEVNNPLSVMISNLGYVAEGLQSLDQALALGHPDVAMAREQLNKLAEAQTESLDEGNRIAQIVRDLKVFSRPRTQSDAEADVTSVIHTAARTSALQMKHRAQLVLQIAPGLPKVKADEGRLDQVLVNLLVNAAQAIPEGDASNQTVIVSASLEEDGRVAIAVRDSGKGIAPEHIARIFEPFFTTKPQGSGTGLGLSISQGIVRSFGGDLEVESQVGVGSTFRILLRAGSSAMTAPVAQPMFHPQARAKRILVVDDEPLFRTSLKRILEPHHVTAVASVAEALIELEKGTIDLIFCDLTMPGQNGIDFHEQVEARWPELLERVVMMTGGALTQESAEFLASTPGETLEKPFELSQVRRLLEDLIARIPPKP